jgi:hypothetical protein
LELRLPGSGLERGLDCHPERSEGSLRLSSQTLRGVYPERSAWAQGDRPSLQMSKPEVFGLQYTDLYATIIRKYVLIIPDAVDYAIF